MKISYSTVGFLIVFSLVPFSANAGRVSSLTVSVQTEGPDGNSFQEVAVKCSHVPDIRLIRKQENSRAWCAVLADGFCANSKLKAANKVCSFKFDKVVKGAVLSSDSKNNNPVEKTQDAVSQGVSPKPVSQDSGIDRISLSEERIKIEEKLLDLRRKKLDLQRKGLELELQLSK